MQAASDPAFDAVALSELHSRAWTLLEEGVRSARSPFHTPAMATQGASGPSVRTVVLRHADPEKQQISCHTDWRSAKRREIQKDGRVSWLFYDRDRKLQLRLAGQAQVHNGDALASERWRVSSINSRRCYSTESPPALSSAHLLAPQQIRIPDGATSLSSSPQWHLSIGCFSAPTVTSARC